MKRIKNIGKRTKNKFRTQNRMNERKKTKNWGKLTEKQKDCNE
jgi:hypothetical protein